MIVNKEQVDTTLPDGTPGKKLVVSYVGEDHQIKFLTYPVPASEMYKWTRTGNYNADPVMRAYDGKPVKKTPCKRLPELRVNELLYNFVKQQSAVAKIFDYNIPETWFCDIETEVGPDGFPEADKANTPVNTIALTKFPRTIVWGRKPLSEKDIEYIRGKYKTYKSDTDDTAVIKDYKFEYRYFPNEADMLMDFFKFIVPIPAIAGWNFLDYDWQYLTNRAKVFNMDISFISPTNNFYNFKTTARNKPYSCTVLMPYHKIIYDYLMVFKQWDRTVEIKENNTLDFASESILGYKKVEHQYDFHKFYRDEYRDYVFYNTVDTILVEQIDKKIHTANIWFSLTSELRTELNMEFSTIRPAEIVLNDFLLRRNMTIPEVYHGNNENVSYAGAFVWKTQPGIYKYVGSLDFSSLYPTSIRQFNISPETFVKKVYSELADGVPEHEQLRKFKIQEYRKKYLKPDEIMTTSGAIYTKRIKGIVPEVLTYYFKKRKNSKKIRKAIDKEQEYIAGLIEKKEKEQKEHLK